MPEKGSLKKIRQIRSTKQMNYFSPTDSRENSLRRSIPMFSKRLHEKDQIDEHEHEDFDDIDFMDKNKGNF